MREKFRSLRKIILSAATLGAIFFPIAFGHAANPQTPPSPQSTAKLSFDVASIKPLTNSNAPQGAYTVGVQVSPDRIFSSCANLKSLIFYAYRLTASVPITGSPEWGTGACGGDFANTFAVEASMPADTTDEQARQMMQTLLAERFKLEAHWEKKDMPIFALVIGKSGFKLKPSDPKNDGPMPPGTMACPPDDLRCHRMGGTSGPISQLAGMLSFNVGRPVIDKTGLTGDYNLNLKWAGDSVTDSSLPSLPAALREKFGLELKSETGPVNVLVIDHVEKPSAN